ncbi:hypothetical protein NP233_g9257 [Leucocoprinus birnbaumii]|uniref:F-box domain-containing protein n=1 Tax=Leucocoprinus birnbaumii TaxID=56174 RepID=A0AAD5VN73_9AGAR|nr:hypothetical protein NP233_g9257 [Leucocoprinus birnbaumii]
MNDYNTNNPVKEALQYEGGRSARYLALPLFLPISSTKYGIIMYLHPQDVLNLSRSTRRLRQLLMTRDARFAWKTSLSTVEGLPRCPSDLSEPQYANLAFDQHCHVGIGTGNFPQAEADQTISFMKCMPKRWAISCVSLTQTDCWNAWRSFFTMDQLVLLLPKTIVLPKPETIFLHTVLTKANPGDGGTTLFYRPAVESYLRELTQLDQSDKEAITRWCRAKRTFLDRTLALYDFGFTLCLLGLLFPTAYLFEPSELLRLAHDATSTGLCILLAMPTNFSKRTCGAPEAITGSANLASANQVPEVTADVLWTCWLDGTDSAGSEWMERFR